MEPWDAELIRRQGAGTLVAIAREGRLARGPVPVDLSWVDEASLALIDLAISRGRSLSLVYPAPAGEVAVLLAAQILIHKLLKREVLPSVGLVTADTTGAARAWEELRVGPPGARTPIAETFPCYRSGPDGESPFGRQPFRGLLVGRRFLNWRVDVVVVDPFAGKVFAEPSVPTIRLFADPLDPSIEQQVARRTPLWGWPEEVLARWNAALEARPGSSVPFSVSHARLATIAHGISITIRTAKHAEAERCVRRLREDLRTLAELAGPDPGRHIRTGLAVSWHHVATLCSLPCSPSQFDRFAGLPPWAARSTATFEPEIAAWARTLTGDLADIASIIASDLSDLRTALEGGNPFLNELSDAADGGKKTLVVVKTRTAAKALLAALGSDPDSNEVGCLHLCAVGALHRQGTWDRAIVVGIPPRWDWHRIDSGLTGDLHVLVLGEADATAAQGVIGALRAARGRWGGLEERARTWREIVGEEPPTAPLPSEALRPSVAIERAREFVPPPDPFDALGGLSVAEPLALGDNGLEGTLAQQTEEGQWTAAVDAVLVRTDKGVVKLPADRIVEVRDGPRIVDCEAQALEPGMWLLLGRRAGRIGLLEALEDKLKHRPDLLAARLVIADYQSLVQKRFAESGLTISKLHQRLKERGCDKTLFATRSWVIPGGSMAPRDLPDLQLLNSVLELGLSEVRVRETFGAVQRRRNFRRAAGRALAEAARQSAVVTDHSRTDPETGLSIADLRDAVLEARVVDVERCASPVPLTDLGHLEGGEA